MLVTGVNFTAYDCESPANNFSALDIRDISPCKSPDTDYEDVEEVKATLIQTNVPKTISVIRCQLKLTKTVIPYGMHSHSFGKQYVEYDDQMIWASPSLCKTMYVTRQFNCPTQLCGGHPSGIIHFPDDNKQYKKQWETQGSYDKDNNAKTKEIKTTSGATVWGVETALLKIIVSNYSANLEVATQVVEIPSLHLRVKYQRESFYDEAIGLLAWDAPDISCHERSAVIARNANASIRRLKPDQRPKGEEHKNVGAILIVEDPKEERATGMVLSQNKDYCSTGCHETNIESLNVCIGTDLPHIDNLEDRPANQVTKLNMQSQGSYLAINSNLGLYDLHAKMQTSICELETRAIKQDFASILNVNNPYALEGMRTTDPEKSLDNAFDVIVMGSVAYFSQCREEIVEIVEVENCTQQIPVRRANGELYFVDPINYKLVKFPNIRECVAGLPVQFKVNGKRFCHDPRHRRCSEGTAPTMIQPAIGGKARGIKVEDLPSLGDQLVSPKQIQQIREIKKIHSLNHVVMDQVAYTAATATLSEDSRLGGIINIAMPLSEEDINRLTNMVAGNMFFLFKWLGQIYLNLFGLMIIFNVVKHLFECLYRMYYMYKVHGWGVYLFKACGATIFSLSFLPGDILKSTVETAQKSMKGWREDIMPPPDYERYQAVINQQAEAVDRLRKTVVRLIANPRQLYTEDEVREIKRELYPSEALTELNLLNEQLPNAPQISVLGRELRVGGHSHGTGSIEQFTTFRPAEEQLPQPPLGPELFVSPPTPHNGQHPDCTKLQPVPTPPRQGYPLNPYRYHWNAPTVAVIHEAPEITTEVLEERKPPDGVDEEKSGNK